MSPLIRWSDKKLDEITNASEWAAHLLSGQTLLGQILVILVFILSLISVGIYVYEATASPGKIEHCSSHDINQKLELALNTYFLFYFIIRFVAAQDKLWFWMEIFSIVDYCTVPPAIVAFFIARIWSGLRFMRFIRLVSLSDVLQYTNILTSASSIRLCQLITKFLATWLVGAGTFHLLENSGDPWVEEMQPKNFTPVTFGTTLYYSIVTMSTVGYGDITPKTSLGQAFVCFYIVIALSVFASHLPEIAEILFSKTKYHAEYKKQAGRKHVVVCGDIHHETVKIFLDDFLHKDREGSQIDVVFINPKLPSMELECILKLHFTRVYYFVGTLLYPYDMDRICMDSADACIVIANVHTRDPNAEDEANIMRVISVKNYVANIKMLVQLLCYHNKPFLNNIPNWNYSKGDNVLCLSELKMGFLAQSVLAPAFSTMLANLFAMRSMKCFVEKAEQNWLRSYMRGSCNEIYADYFSPYFYGMTFKEAADVCAHKLKVLLFAVDAKKKQYSSRYDFTYVKSLAINPGSSVIIEPWCQGYFICDSQSDAHAAYLFCLNCHNNITNPKDIRECQCDDRYNTLDDIAITNTQTKTDALLDSCDKASSLHADMQVSVTSCCDKRSSSLTTSVLKRRAPSPILHSPPPDPKPPNLSMLPALMEQYYEEETYQEGEIATRKPDEGPSKFDATGMYHWCPARDFTAASFSMGTVLPNKLNKHIVVCLIAEKSSPLIGLVNFVMPLRASNYNIDELHPIVFVGDGEFLQREWATLCHFPKIYVYPGNPMNRFILREIKVNHCSSCIVLSAKQQFSTSDPYLIDKEVILCTLNIRAMTFGEEIKFERLSSFINCSFAPTSKDIEAIDSQMSNSQVLSKKGGNKAMSNFQKCLAPMVTVLTVDNNIHFLNHDDNESSSGEVYLTSPFACGTAFISSVLDSLMSTAYHNPNSIALVRSLVTGGATPDFELYLAEGLGIFGAVSNADIKEKRSRCRIEQKSLESLHFYEQNATYGALFSKLIREQDILILGLYSLMKDDNDELISDVLVGSRYVICNPPFDYPVSQNDLVFCLTPFTAGNLSQPSSRNLKLPDENNKL